MIPKEDIVSVVHEALQQVESTRKPLFERPTTARGWCIVGGAVVGIISFLWTAAIYLHRVSEHHKQPSHAGAISMVERIEDAVTTHVHDEIKHIRDAELELKILEKTRPIQADIQRMQSDVRSIKTKVEILINRNER